MKINTSTIIRWYDGSDIMPGVEKPLTVKEVLKSACTGILETDKTMSREEKLQLDVLSHRFYACKDDVEITIEEAAIVKTRVEKMFVPRIFAAINNMIEGKEAVI